ncbi:MULTISPECIES: AbfB domain-containing protein [unclassified Solwaraspora]|uniref:AbfB domain-containing protein n=1 Tax=unclassified Solwaraspora TaxID=2627926 RepID=UPI00259B3ED9|nr:AbfB domain-containing protein [Solwaraspora sp. WMMA2056]WJK38742.1 AbfB domain-containing protein [Solwaraspora sp. WMMA2056]
MSEKDDEKTRLRIGGWLPNDGAPGSVSPPPPDAPAPDAPRTPGAVARHSAANFLRRVTPNRPLTAIVPRSGARNAARQAAAAAAAANRVAPADLPTGGLGDTGDVGRGATYQAGHADQQPNAQRRLVLGGAALVTITVLIGIAVAQDSAEQAPIRGEFAANAPAVIPSTGTSTGTDDPATADPDSDTDLPGADGPVGDPAAGATPTPGEATGGAAPGTGTTAPAGGTATTPPAPAPPTTPAAPAEVPLLIDTRVNLEVAGLPGHRIRHRDGIVVVEPVSTASRSDVKADATFVVRAGLANRNCLSFESVNAPGHYLRHYEFRIFLHRNDGSAIFRADTTFCVVPGIGGKHTSLRSHNYPDRFLRHDTHKQMRISPIGDGSSAATATFIARTPV